MLTLYFGVLDALQFYLIMTDLIQQFFFAADPVRKSSKILPKRRVLSEKHRMQA